MLANMRQCFLARRALWPVDAFSDKVKLKSTVPLIFPSLLDCGF
jgi:hypothetical protein